MENELRFVHREETFNDLAVCGANLHGVNGLNNMMPSNTCSRCGSSVPSGTKFCPTCGNRL